MSTERIKGCLEWVLMVALVLGGGALAQAQSDQTTPNDDHPSGKIVRIGPPDSGQVSVDQDQNVDEQTLAQPELPKHWIGLLGGPVSDELRAQLDIPAGEGVLVRSVVPNSPAEKAGLQVFDVVLRANDTPLTDITDLLALVKSQGESGGQITLDVLRRGQHQSLTVTPEARPETPVPSLGRSGQPMPFGMFRPRGMFSQRQNFGLSQMPNGVSVSIEKQNDEPAHVTVQRGNDTWHIVGDDSKSLAQLPEDVRPFVEQLLAGSGQTQFPLMPGMPGPPAFHGGIDNDLMQQQLEGMEQQLQQMKSMLEQSVEPQHPADQPQENNQ